MVIRTGQEEVEQIIERIEYETVTFNYSQLFVPVYTLIYRYKCLGIVVDIARAKIQVGTENIRVKIKLFEICLMLAIQHGLAAWGNIIERMQSEPLKQLLQLPISTPVAGALIETLLQPAKKHLQYNTIMLCHSIINNEEERIVKNVNTILS